MRIFIGFSLSDENKNQIQLFQQSISTGRKIKPNLFHVTLLFLGELNINQIKLAKEILSKVQFFEFFIQTKRIMKLRDLVVIELTKTEELLKCATLIYEEFEKNGFQLEKRKFYPHITIARNSVDQINDLFTLKQKVNQICLFSSQFINNQLHYVIEYQIPLKK